MALDLVIWIDSLVSLTTLSERDEVTTSVLLVNTTWVLVAFKSEEAFLRL